MDKDEIIKLMRTCNAVLAVRRTPVVTFVFKGKARELRNMLETDLRAIVGRERKAADV